MCHWVLSHNTERTLMHHANAISSLLSQHGFASGYTLKESDHAEGHKQEKSTQKENRLQSKYADNFFFIHGRMAYVCALSSPNTCISN